MPEIRKRRRNYPLDPCLNFYPSKSSSSSSNVSKAPSVSSRKRYPVSSHSRTPSRSESPPIFAFTCPVTPPKVLPITAESRNSRSSTNVERAPSPHLTVEQYLRRPVSKRKLPRTYAKRGKRKRRRLANADSSSDGGSTSICFSRGTNKLTLQEKTTRSTSLSRIQIGLPPFDHAQTPEFSHIPMPEFDSIHNPESYTVSNLFHYPASPMDENLNIQIQIADQPRMANSQTRTRFKSWDFNFSTHAYNDGIPSDKTEEDEECHTANIRPVSHWRIPFYQANQPQLKQDIQRAVEIHQPVPLSFVSWDQHEGTLKKSKLERQSNTDKGVKPKANAIGTSSRIPLVFEPVNNGLHFLSDVPEVITPLPEKMNLQLLSSEYGLRRPSSPPANVERMTQLPARFSPSVTSHDLRKPISPLLPSTFAEITAVNSRPSDLLMSPGHVRTSSSDHCSSESAKVECDKPKPPLTNIKSFESMVPRLVAATQAVLTRPNTTTVHNSEDNHTNFIAKSGRLGFRKFARPSTLHNPSIPDFLDQQDPILHLCPSKDEDDDDDDPSVPFDDGGSPFRESSPWPNPYRKNDDSEAYSQEIPPWPPSPRFGSVMKDPKSGSTLRADEPTFRADTPSWSSSISGV